MALYPFQYLLQTFVSNDRLNIKIFLSWKEKAAILDEFCQVGGYHRKHAIRLLRKYKRFTKPKPKKKGRKPIYDKKALLRPLKKIWLKANLPRSKRLKALRPLWLPGYVKIHGKLSEKLINDLLSLSPATIDRFLQHTRIRSNKRGRSTTKPGTLLRKKIPISTNPVGRIPPTLSRSGYGSTLRRLPFWDVCLHYRLRRYRHRMD